MRRVRRKGGRTRRSFGRRGLKQINSGAVTPIWQPGSGAFFDPKNRFKRQKRVANGRKRKRSGSDTIAKRAEFGDQYIQNIRRNIRQGRKLSTLRYLSKLSSADATAPYDLGHRVYTNFSTTPLTVIGLYTGGSATITNYPIYAFDMTQANYQSGLTYLAPACLRLNYDSSISKLIWTPVVGLDPDGSFSNNFSANQPNGLKYLDSKTTFQRSFLEYLAMNFNFTGPTTKPARVTLQLVVFTDEWADPFGQCGFYKNGLDQEIIQHERFWSEEAARLVENPIHKIARYQRRLPYRVLSSKMIDFQPTSTTESDVRGHIQTIKWFRRVNRVLNYSSRDAGPYDNNSMQSSSLMAPLNAQQAENFGYRPQRSARYMLIVRANCWDKDTAATPSTATNVRMEWNITARHRIQTAGAALPNP